MRSIQAAERVKTMGRRVDQTGRHLPPSEPFICHLFPFYRSYDALDQFYPSFMRQAKISVYVVTQSRDAAVRLSPVRG